MGREVSLVGTLSQPLAHCSPINISFYSLSGNPTPAPKPQSTTSIYQSSATLLSFPPFPFPLPGNKKKYLPQFLLFMPVFSADEKDSGRFQLRSVVGYPCVSGSWEKRK